jgi:hypothetical protein
MDIDSLFKQKMIIAPVYVKRYTLSVNVHFRCTCARDLRDPSTPSIFHTWRLLLAYRFNASNENTQDAHSKDNSSTEDQSSQSGHGSRPEGENALILEDPGGADKAVLVVFASFERLHSIKKGQ